MKKQFHFQDYTPQPLQLLVNLNEGTKKSISTLTAEYKTVDMRIETQIHSGIREQASTQTIPLPYPQPPTCAQPASLLKFLKRTQLLLNKELTQHIPLYEGVAKLFRRESRQLHTLHYVTEEALSLTSLSWNASGGLLAASFAHQVHDEICAHRGVVCIWSMHKIHTHTTIKTANCVTCVEFHPKRPSLFVCGTYVGEVLLYDGEELIGRSTVEEYHHKDIVNKVIWWGYHSLEKGETLYNVLSLGADGKILLWDPNPSGQGKVVFKHPLKGFLMLRKKDGITIPVAGLSICQSKSNRNMFIIGSEGGSILRAILNPLNSLLNTQGKLLLQMASPIKFHSSLHPFLLNLFPKNLRDMRSKLQSSYSQLQVDSLSTLFSLQPQLGKIYPNPISFAYEAMAYPIESISMNEYGLMLINACEGYNRIYSEQAREMVQVVEEGHSWAWLRGGSRMGGFLHNEWAVVDWLQDEVVFKVGVGDGVVWRESVGGGVAVGYDHKWIKVMQLADAYYEHDQKRISAIQIKIEEMLKK